MEHLIATWGYLAIFGLSIAQSACVPTSSELTFGFAGFLAFAGHFNVVEVIIVGATGELIGAYIAWAFGLTAGRALVLRYGRYLRINESLLDRLQGWFERHPRWGVFASRLLPVVRNFVALAAGLGEVPALSFGVLTFLGSLVWDGGLTILGYMVGSAWHHMVHTVSDVGYGVVAVVATIVLLTLLTHRGVSRSLGNVPGSASVVGMGDARTLTERSNFHREDSSPLDDPSGYLNALRRLSEANPVLNQDAAHGTETSRRNPSRTGDN